MSIGDRTSPADRARWDITKVVTEISKNIRTDWGGKDYRQLITKKAKEDQWLRDAGVTNAGQSFLNDFADYIRGQARYHIEASRARITTHGFVEELKTRLSQGVSRKVLFDNPLTKMTDEQLIIVIVDNIEINFGNRDEDQRCIESMQKSDYLKNWPITKMNDTVLMHMAKFVHKICEEQVKACRTRVQNTLQEATLRLKKIAEERATYRNSHQNAPNATTANGTQKNLSLADMTA